jgi:hypothetical protein
MVMDGDGCRWMSMDVDGDGGSCSRGVSDLGKL